MSQTTIRVSTDTRDTLEKLKAVPQEPLDAVIRRMIDTLGQGADDEGVMRDSLNLLMVQRLKKLKGALSVEEAREHASAVAKRSGGGSGSGVQPRTGSARKSSR